MDGLAGKELPAGFEGEGSPGCALLNARKLQSNFSNGVEVNGAARHNAPVYQYVSTAGALAVRDFQRA